MNDSQRDKMLLGLGYILGRTKKAGAALRLYNWYSSSPVGPKAVGLAQGAVKSDQGQQIIGQVKGPLVDAARQAAMQVALNRVTKLSEGLTARTEALKDVGVTTIEGTAEVVEGTAETAGDTAKKAGGGVKGALGKLKPGKKKEPEAQKEEEPEEEPEDTPEEEDDDESEDEEVEISKDDGPNYEQDDEEGEEANSEEKEDANA